MDEPTFGEDGPPDNPSPDGPRPADHDGSTSADTDLPRAPVQRLPDDLLPSAVTRRRFVLGVGFGAATIAFLRRLPTPPDTAGAAGPTTLPAVPRPTTVPPAPTTGVPDIQPSLGASEVAQDGRVHDVVVAGGRVIDPETGFDAVAHVGIDGDTVTRISLDPLVGSTTLDATGLVVAPGFIDILSYRPNGYGEWNKIADGVTTNLCMHGIDGPMHEFLRLTAEHRPPVNYGGATDQYSHRVSLEVNLDYASDPQLNELIRLADVDIRAGALGIHEQPEYVPGVTLDEMLRHGDLAAAHGVPLCLHIRYSENLEPGTQEEAVDEAISVARRTGCAVHIEHLNSTGGTGRMSEAVAQLDSARSEGLSITACTYPYTFWATKPGTARFKDFQEKFGISYGDLQVAGTSTRLDEAGWRRAIAENSLVAAFAMSDDDVDTLLRTPWTLLGSDAILERPHNNHPRASGCFSRVLGHYVRDRGVLTLPEALAKMTILPARLLDGRSPAMARRGRLQAGAAADVTVFDPAAISDRATIEQTWLESTGVHHVLVGGQVVRSGGVTDRSVRPGVAILSGQA
jgi:dihydroorotase|tara:strand:+ start:957 stop:2669 length:1713 start_codon:yes stop_codon:yes gene_type:complete